MTPITEGKKGYDLQLTIDIDLQQKVDQILQDTLYANKDNEYRKNFKQVFVSLMDPNTGEILTMSGQQLNAAVRGMVAQVCHMVKVEEI